MEIEVVVWLVIGEEDGVSKVLVKKEDDSE